MHHLTTDDNNFTNEDTAVNGDVSINDTPSGDGGNTWSVVTNPAHGTLSFNNDGTYTYTPEADYNGTDSFDYQLCDIDGDCSPATVTITIGSINDLPLTADDSNTTNEDTPVNGDISEQRHSKRRRREHLVGCYQSDTWNANF